MRHKGEDGTIPCLKHIIEGKCTAPENKCKFSHDVAQREFTDLEKEHVRSELGRNRKNREIQKARKMRGTGIRLRAQPLPRKEKVEQKEKAGKARKVEKAKKRQGR